MTYEILSSLVDRMIEAAVAAEMRLAGWEVEYGLGVPLGGGLGATGRVGDALVASPSRFEKRNVDGWHLELTADGGFDCRVDFADPPEDRLDRPDGAPHVALLEGFRAKWQAKIPPLFEPFYELPDPAAFAELADRVDRPAQLVSSGHLLGEDLEGQIVRPNQHIDDMVDLPDEITHWMGPAADSFRRGFLDNLADTTEMQFFVLVLLKAALEQEREVWRAARQDVEELARASLSAFGDCGRGGGGNAELALAIFTAIARVTSAFLPVAGSVAISTAIGVAGIAKAAQRDQPSGPTEAMVSGSTPDAVFSSMKGLLERINSGISESERFIARRMDALAGHMVDDRDSFHPGVAARFLGVTAPGALHSGGFQVNTSRLRYTSRTMYPAADDFAAAARQPGLTPPHGPFSRTASVGAGSLGPASSILAVGAELAAIFAETGFFIEESAQRVKICADLYDGTDEDLVAKRLRRHLGEMRQGYEKLQGAFPILGERPGWAA